MQTPKLPSIIPHWQVNVSQWWHAEGMGWVLEVCVGVLAVSHAACHNLWSFVGHANQNTKEVEPRWQGRWQAGGNQASRGCEEQ